MFFLSLKGIRATWSTGWNQKVRVFSWTKDSWTQWHTVCTRLIELAIRGRCYNAVIRNAFKFCSFFHTKLRTATLRHNIEGQVKSHPSFIFSISKLYIEGCLVFKLYCNIFCFSGCVAQFTIAKLSPLQFIWSGICTVNLGIFTTCFNVLMKFILVNFWERYSNQD